MAFIKSGKLVQSGPPRQLVERLGRHIVEIESRDIDALAQRLSRELGPCLKDGEIAQFRYAEEDVTPLARLQGELGAQIKALRWRRPNLNDVFLWIAEGKI